MQSAVVTVKIVVAETLYSETCTYSSKSVICAKFNFFTIDQCITCFVVEINLGCTRLSASLRSNMSPMLTLLSPEMSMYWTAAALPAPRNHCQPKKDIVCTNIYATAPMIIACFATASNKFCTILHPQGHHLLEFRHQAPLLDTVY
jgi:hypothetical protein